MDRLQGLLEVLCEREGGDALTVTATRASSSHRPDSTKHARAQLPREYETDPTDGTLSEVVGGAGGSAAETRPHSEILKLPFSNSTTE